MRNRIAFLLAASVFIYGCISEPPQKEARPPAVSHGQGAPQDGFSGHNSMNSIDYAGTYVWEGGAVGGEARSLTLAYDGAYTLARADGSEAAGTYQWDVTGTTVALRMPSGAPLTFWVGEGFIKFVTPGAEEGRVFKKTP